MHRTQESLLHPSLPATQPVENTIPPFLKALIVAISAVAGFIFGLFLAGLAGAVLGALASSAIAIAAPHLFFVPKPHQTAPDVDLSEPNTIPSPVTEDLGRDSKQQSSFALPPFSENPAPRVEKSQIANEIALPPLASPLVQTVRFASIVPAVSSPYKAGDFDVPFNFEKELASLYLLPGHDTFIEDEEELGGYLPNLRTSLMRVLSYSQCDNNEKNALKEHFEKKLLPIYDSLDSLFEHLDKFAGTRALAEKMRESLATYWRNAKPYRNSIAGDRERVRRMIQMIDRAMLLIPES